MDTLYNNFLQIQPRPLVLMIKLKKVKVVSHKYLLLPIYKIAEIPFYILALLLVAANYLCQYKTCHKITIFSTTCIIIKLLL